MKMKRMFALLLSVCVLLSSFPGEMLGVHVYADEMIEEENISEELEAEPAVIDKESEIIGEESEIADEESEIIDEEPEIFDEEPEIIEETIIPADDSETVSNSKSEESSDFELEAKVDDLDEDELEGMASVNATQVKLYSISYNHGDYLTLPSGYASSFQIKVSGASLVPSYHVRSGKDIVQVSPEGLITLVKTDWYSGGEYSYSTYKTGEAEVEVTVGSETFIIYVTSIDYADLYVNQVMDDYIRKNITSNMSDYDKVVKILEFICSYEYSVYASSAMDMIITGGGDCWASADMVVTMCGKIGIESRGRDGRGDPGAGSGHQNALVYLKDGIYIAEASYVVPAPRFYNLWKTDLFKTQELEDGTIEILQYEGKDTDTDVVIPETIDGKTVTSIGEKCFLYGAVNLTSIQIPDTVKTIKSQAFGWVTTLTTLTLPASLEYIAGDALYSCTGLTYIKVPSTNTTYMSKDGVLYTKDGKKLVLAPAGLKSISFPSGVEIIGTGSFSDSALKQIDIPGSVKTIESMAFSYTQLEKVTLHEGLKTIEDNAFLYSYLRSIAIPSTVTSIGDYAFYNTHSASFSGSRVSLGVESFRAAGCMIGKKGSSFEQYAKANSIPFLEMEADGKVTMNESWFQLASNYYIFYPDYIWEPTVYFSLEYGLPERIFDIVYKDNISPGTGKVIISNDLFRNSVILTFTLADPYGHTWGERVVVSVASCTTEGRVEVHCLDCDDVVIETTPALGHDWGDWTRANISTHVRTCKNDPSHKQTEAHNLANPVPARRPTCTQEGSERYTCIDCGSVKNETVPALGHDWVNSGTHPTEDSWGHAVMICSRCKEAGGEFDYLDVVITATTSFYEAPSYGSKKVKTAAEGTEWMVTEIQDGWMMIWGEGWIPGFYGYILTTPQPSTRDKIGQGTVETKMKIYTYPSVNAESIGSVSVGSVRNLYAQSGNWYQIYASGQYVWVRASGFKFDKASTNVRISTGIITATTTLHYGPGNYYDTCGLLVEGRIVNIYEICNGWYKVYSGGKYVWVDGNYIFDQATPEPKVDDKIGQGTTSVKVKIYSQPNANLEVLGTIPAERVRNLYAQSGNWYQIYVTGIGFCWVRCDGFSYTKANSNASYATAVFTERTVTYYGHGYDYETAAIITAGTKVNVYAQWENWYLVYKTGKYLWIDGKYLKDFALK